jgi:DNA adenine methylase
VTAPAERRPLNPRFPSPLRYPGGKGKVANFMKLLFMENGLLGCDYVEPYAGGATVALSLLFEGYADRIFINDIDPAVHAFWHSVLFETDALCGRIADVELTVEEWQRQREVVSSRDAGMLDLGFAAFYMNRANRSGIIAGGIIGGRDQTGPWKLDARFNREDLIRRIRKIQRFESRIVLSALDALEFLKPWCQDEADPALVYLDPPYYTKGGDLYRNFYSPEDHDAVAQSVLRLRVPWIVSYDAHPAIEALYGDHLSVRYSLSYSAATRSRGSEVMFFSPNIVVPDVPSPGGITPLTVGKRLAQMSGA